MAFLDQVTKTICNLRKGTLKHKRSVSYSVLSKMQILEIPSLRHQTLSIAK